MKLKVFAKTLAGKNKNSKQDGVFFWKNNFNNFLFGVADGVGSYEKSGLGVKIIKKELKIFFLKQNFSLLEEKGIKEWGDSTLKEIQKSFLKFFSQIAVALTFSILNKNKIYFFHIGDTRAFQKKNNLSSSFQLTNDHSSLVNSEINFFQFKSFLTNSLSNKKSFFFDFFSISTFDGFLFFTSDGIHDFLSLKDFSDIFKSKEKVEDIVNFIFTKTDLETNDDDRSLLIVKLKL